MLVLVAGSGMHGVLPLPLKTHRPSRAPSSPGWGILWGFTAFSPEIAAPFTNQSIRLAVFAIPPMNTSQRVKLLGSITALLSFPVVTIPVAMSRPLPATTAQAVPVHAVVASGPEQHKRLLQLIHVPLQ